MATLNTYTGLSAEQRSFYDRALLERLTPELVYARFGQQRSIPKNSGDTVQFRRFDAEEANTTPLAEGVTPEGGALSISALTAKLEQYGDFKLITDRLDLMGIDPVITETVQLLGEKAGLSVDTLVRDAVTAGTRVIFAGDKASRGTLESRDKITSKEIRRAVQQLRTYGAKPFEDGCYIGIIGPEVQADLMDDAFWQDVSRYNGGEGIMKGEIGKLFGVRFVMSPNAKVWPKAGIDKDDVQGTVILGRSAYGLVDIAGSAKPRTIVKALGSAGSLDPLDQRASVGYKFLFAAKILNEKAMIRIESVSAY